MRHANHLLIGLIIYILLPVNSNANNFTFANYSIDQGLSNSSVTSIAQDKKGYIWIATSDGLNRFDSYQFENFFYKENDPNSLCSNSIFTLHIDQSGTLWIATKNGLSRYNDKTQNFNNFLQDTPSQYVTDIIEKDNNTLILIDRTAITFFDTKNLNYRRIKLFQSKQQWIYSSLLISPIELLLGTADGIYIYNMHRKVLRKVSPKFNNQKINCIKLAKTGYWIGTEDKGLYKLDESFRILKNYSLSENGNKKICSNSIRCLSIDTQSNLWVGTYNGLSIINYTEEVVKSYIHNELNSESIAQNSIRCISPDNQGGIWIGTYYGGINYTNPLKDKFGKIKAMPFGKGLNDKVISTIREDMQGDLWIGTNDNGLNILDRKSNTFRYYNTENHLSKNIGSNNIKSILILSETTALVGTHKNGLSLIDKNKGIIKCWNNKNSRIESADVANIVKINNNEYWIATLNGLRIFNGNDFTPINDLMLRKTASKRAIFFLYKSRQDDVWFGCRDGFFCYSLKNKRLTHFDDLLKFDTHRLSVNVITEDPKGNIWIGSSKGIVVIHKNLKTYNKWSTKNGLPNDYVYGIIPTEKDMWISTNNGLVRFSLADSQIRTFVTSDGLLSNQFNDYSFFKSNRGELFFGGINGINFFYPENLINNPYSPTPIINKIKVFNTVVIPNDHTGILDENVEDKDKIVLKHNQNSINICFVALNYLSSQRNTYQYKLDGFDKNWIETGEREATYSNLNSGTYVFLLKSKNNDGKWSNTIAKLEIKIAPPWYKTWWAYIIWIALSLTLFFVLFRVMIMREKMEHQIQIEKIEKMRNQELHELQLRYFINISHEFKTPLTLILVPIQELMDKEFDNPWLKQQIKYVYKNTQKLLYLVNNFLNYRKAELGYIPLKTSFIEVTPLLYDLYLLFEKLAKQKNIDFDFESKVDGLFFQVDLNYLERIVTNLLSNAFKNTPNSGTIKIKVFQKPGFLIIEIIDTGKGIPQNIQNLIFDRFYQVEQDQFGTGIGLSLVKRLVSLHHGKIELESDLDKGSTFRIILPQNEFEYSENEKTSELSNINQEQINFEILNIEEENTSDLPIVQHKYSIMIVDDNIDILNYLRDSFAPSYNIFTATNGQQGLDLLKDTTIDIIISDVMMPVMDGISFCNKIKRNIKYSHIPFIILTAKDDLTSEQQALTMGADDYIAKPFVISILKTKVSNIISMREKVRSHYQAGEKIEPENLAFSILDKEFLNRAFKVVNENIDNINFGVEEFSKAMAISRTGAQQKLRAIIGESVVEFIRRIRIEKAAELLKTGKYTIAEISTMVGYNTPSYFTVSFKKHFNCLPTEYFKDIQNK